jgi:crossover junction endodeoxyribonuclease RuvC
MRILGIDPGLQHTGWGIIDDEGMRFRYVAHGVISTSSKDAMSHRLTLLFKGIQEIVSAYTPYHAAVEEVFMNKNPQSTLKLGMARGVVLFTPSYCNVPVYEYTANQVKKTVVGAGHAHKDQISHMVQRLIHKCPSVEKDGADALAIALCHAHHGARLEKWVV